MKEILFPIIKKPITLQQTLVSLAKINALFLAYCLIITAIALIFKNPNDVTTNLYNNPIIAWAKIPSLIFMFWTAWINYKILKTRLQTNGYKLPIVTIYLFLGSFYFIFHPDGIFTFVLALAICYYSGKKFIKEKANWSTQLAFILLLIHPNHVIINLIKCWDFNKRNKKYEISSSRYHC